MSAAPLKDLKLQDLCEDIKAGKHNKADLFNKYGPVYARQYKAVGHCIDLVKKPATYSPRLPLKVSIWFGNAGAGKTFACQQLAMDGEKSMWVADCDKILKGWWDGYAGEEIVLLDDFRGEVMKPHNLINLIDNHDASKPIKGGFIMFAPGYLLITSPDHPINWWPNWYLKTDNNWAQIRRRITSIFHCEKQGDEYKTNDVSQLDPLTFKREEVFKDWKPKQ